MSLTPESMHMLMWIMSDRAIPRSFSMMEGFGVHSYRLVNAEGKSHFVKFHWKPIRGVHSLVWDEAVKLAGQDPDFHRRDMFDSIEKGNFFEWEFGVQILPEEDEMKFDFDILDATKIIPEDLIPVQLVGKMVLNRNPDNYFAETEQVAFMTSNVVPGIDFSNDPLDGHTMEEVGPKPGFVSYPQEVGGPKIRERSPSFEDHYGQATLFWNSQTPVEKQHIVKALQFELSKVETRKVRQRILEHLGKINEYWPRKWRRVSAKRPARRRANRNSKPRRERPTLPMSWNSSKRPRRRPPLLAACSRRKG
jgi:catalase